MSGSTHIDMINTDDAVSIKEKQKDERKDGYSKNTEKINTMKKSLENQKCGQCWAGVRVRYEEPYQAFINYHLQGNRYHYKLPAKEMEKETDCQ